MTTLQKSIQQGINLRGTRYEGFSARELQKANPQLAQKWALFIRHNRKQLIQEIAGRICAS